MKTKFTTRTTEILLCIIAAMWSVLAHAQIGEEFTSPSLGGKLGYVFFKDGMDLKEYRLNVSTDGPLLMEFAIRDFKNYGGSLDIPFRKFLATDGNVVPYVLIGPGLDFWHTSIRMSYTTEELTGFKDKKECEVYALARDIWGNWVPVERCYNSPEPIFETVTRDYTDTSNTLMGGGHFGFGGMLSAYPLFFDGKFKTRYALGKDFFESGSSLLHEIRITLEIRNDIVLSSALDFEAALIYEAVTNKIGSSSWSDFSHRFIPYIGLRYNIGRITKDVSNKDGERGTKSQGSAVHTVHTPPPKPASTQTIQKTPLKSATTPTRPGRKPVQISVPSLELPKIHNVSLGVTGGYKRGPQKGFSGLNLTYRGRNPDKLYYFFPAVTLATMSKEIEVISSYGSLYGSSYKIGNRVLAISGGVGLNCRHIKELSGVLPPNLNPYFEWGLGYAFTSYWNDYESETFSDRDWVALTWDAGLGVEYWLTEQNAIDLYFNRQHIIDFGSEDFHYWKVNVALTFR